MTYSVGPSAGSCTTSLWATPGGHGPPGDAREEVGVASMEKERLRALTGVLTEWQFEESLQPFVARVPIHGGKFASKSINGLE